MTFFLPDALHGYAGHRAYDVGHHAFVHYALLALSDAFLPGLLCLVELLLHPQALVAQVGGLLEVLVLGGFPLSAVEVLDESL